MIKSKSPLAIAIFTAVRAQWSVKKLNIMSAYGEDTPVSGDALVQLKYALAQK